MRLALGPFQSWRSSWWHWSRAASLQKPMPIADITYSAPRVHCALHKVNTTESNEKQSRRMGRNLARKKGSTEGRAGRGRSRESALFRSSDFLLRMILYLNWSPLSREYLLSVPKLGKPTSRYQNSWLPQLARQPQDRPQLITRRSQIISDAALSIYFLWPKL